MSIVKQILVHTVCILKLQYLWVFSEGDIPLVRKPIEKKFLTLFFDPSYDDTGARRLSKG